MPEVEKAASLVRTVALGKTIVKVETAEDAIVFSGVTHTDFVSPLITDFSLCFLYNVRLKSSVAAQLRVWDDMVSQVVFQCSKVALTVEIKRQSVLLRIGWRRQNACPALWYDGDASGKLYPPATLRDQH